MMVFVVSNRLERQKSAWILDEFSVAMKKQPARLQHPGSELYLVSSSDDAQLPQPDEWVICQSELKYLSTQIKYDTVWDESDLHTVKCHVFTRVRVWFKDNQVDNEAMTEYSFNHGSVCFHIIRIHHQESTSFWPKFNDSLSITSCPLEIPPIQPLLGNTSHTLGPTWKHTSSWIKVDVFGRQKAASWHHCLLTEDLDKKPVFGGFRGDHQRGNFACRDCKTPVLFAFPLSAWFYLPKILSCHSGVTIRVNNQHILAL